jgi:hypothetical protein
MTGRAGHRRLGTTPSVGGGLRWSNAPQWAERRIAAPTTPRVGARSRQAQVGSTRKCAGEGVSVHIPMRLSVPGPLVRPAVRRHGVPLHMVVLARSATCVVLSKKTV